MNAPARTYDLPDYLTPAHIANLPGDLQSRFTRLMSFVAKSSAQRQFYDLFPDNDNIVDGQTIYSRDRYLKHIEFFDAGLNYRERAFLAANRVGKTFAGAYEMTAHLTGLYPHWWRGRRFDAPILAWACGKSGETTRDIVQNALLGDVTYEGSKKGVTGSGMIPGGLLGRLLWKSSGGDALDTIMVKHVSGGWSKLSFKAYEQGRGSFEGTAKHVIWLDEECPLDVYGECVIRTATTGGIIMLTFTPLEGMTDTVMQFMLQPDF